MRIIFIAMLTVFVLLSAGCGSGVTIYAPVMDGGAIERIPKSGVYRVMPGESLYSIAWRYGLDYRDLAKRNHLKQFHIQVGQVLYLRGRPKQIMPAAAPRSVPTVKTKPIVRARHYPLTLEKPEKEPAARVTSWRWPAEGRVVSTFSASNKGINITGLMGDPVFASAAGKVVYSGNGLRAYGNLIIIKHNGEFLTAYAHNSRVLVGEGEWVKAGQVIAYIGNSGTKKTILHFEIRRGGKPVNPLRYLSSR